MGDLKLETIFDLIKNKETLGFEALYKQHFPMIYGIAYSVTGDDTQSKDVVQNVFIKLFQLKADKFPESHEMTWLYTVTKNEALQVMRKEKQVLNVAAIKELPIMDKGIEEFTDMDTYHSLIESLNDQQKQVVTLKVLGGLSHREIAQILGKPIGTIQWIYNTSIKHLRRALCALCGFIIILGGSFIVRLYDYLTRPEMPQLMGATTSPEVDKILIALGLAFIGAVGAVVIFIRNSDKLPVKIKFNL